MLTLAPLMWAGNAIVGRLVHDLISPFTLNLLRWCIAFVILLPWGGYVLRKNSAMWKCWKQYAVLGVLGIGCYNALLYLALKTSSAINVTLVGSSMPIWMLLIGRIWFGTAISGRQAVGAVLSVLGVAVVLSRGDIHQLLGLHLVPGTGSFCWPPSSGRSTAGCWHAVRRPCRARKAFAATGWAF